MQIASCHQVSYSSSFRFSGFPSFALRICFLLLLVVSLGASGATAETIRVGGMTFHVDELTPVDDDAVRVSLFGDARVIPLSRLNDFVIERYFAREDSTVRFSVDSLTSFFEQAVADHKPQRAKFTYQLLSRHPDFSEQLQEEFIEEFLHRPEALPAFQAVLGGAGSETAHNRVFFAMIVAVGQEDPTWVRNTVSKTIYEETDAFSAFVLDWFASTLEQGKLARADKLLEFVADFYQKDHEFYERLSLLLHRTRNALAAVRANRLEELYPIIELGQSDFVLARVLQPIALEAIHSAAKKELESGNAPKALVLLSRIDVEQRTPQTHELVVASLQKLPASHTLVGDDVQVRFLLKVVAENDDRVKNAYISYLERRLHYLFSAGKLRGAEDTLTLLAEYRPDPNRANDRLRVGLAIAWCAAGYRNKGERLLDRVRSEVSFQDRLTLFRLGYYVNTQSFAIVLTLIVLIMGLVAYRVRAILDSVGQIEELGDEIWVENSVFEADPGEEPHSPFAQVRKGLNPRMHEYTTLLRKFGLTVDADLKSIKGAYRTVIKEVHPDLHEEGDTEMQETFIRMTTAYERILELRKILKMSEE